MNKDSYRITYKKIKGTWISYLFLLACTSFFINRMLGIILCAISLLLTVIYKNSSYNKCVMNYNYAIKMVNAEENEKAKYYLNKAIEYDKTQKETYFFLGCLYFDECDYAKALDCLKLGGVDNINNPKLYYVLGKCYFHIDNYDKAIEYLRSTTYMEDKVLEKDRIYTLGRAYTEIRAYKDALKCLESISFECEDKLKGDALEYYYFLGVNYYFTDKFKEAENCFKKVMLVDKKYKFVDIYADRLGITM